MQIDILSLFPEMFAGPLHESMIGNAIENDVINVDVTNFRDFTTDKHNHVDDYPYGGGAGMLLQPQPIFDALASVQEKHPAPGRVILLDPAGVQFNQHVARRLLQKESLAVEGAEVRLIAKAPPDKRYSPGCYGYWCRSDDEMALLGMLCMLQCFNDVHDRLGTWTT